MFEIHYHFYHSKPVSINQQFKEKEKVVKLLNHLTSAGYEYPLKDINRYILYSMFQALIKIPNLSLILVNTETQEAISFNCFEKNIIIRTGSVIDKIYGDRQEVKLNDIKNLDILSNNNNSLFNCGVKSSLTLSYKDEFKITI
jgi:hypothetical protein